MVCVKESSFPLSAYKYSCFDGEEEATRKKTVTLSFEKHTKAERNFPNQKEKEKKFSSFSRVRNFIFESRRKCV
jgi:hypothetical protein